MFVFYATVWTIVQTEIVLLYACCQRSDNRTQALRIRTYVRTLCTERNNGVDGRSDGCDCRVRVRWHIHLHVRYIFHKGVQVGVNVYLYNTHTHIPSFSL